MTQRLKGGFVASFLAINRKEIVHIARDRSTIVAILVIPLLQLGLFGAVDMQVERLPTVVVEHSHSHYSRELLAKLRATGTFDLISTARDGGEAQASIAAGENRIAIVIPPDYHEQRVRTGRGRVQVLIDGSDASIANAALATLQGLSASTGIARVDQGAEHNEFTPVVLYNPRGRTAVFLLPGLIAILLQIAGVVQTTTTIVREREQGTLEQLLLTPIDPLGMLFGKIFPYLGLSMIQAVVVVAVMHWLFSVPIHGSLGMLALATVAYLFVLLATGVFISSIASTQQQANEMAQALFIPAFFLSGFMFPRAGLPWPLAWLGLAFPATHMMEIMRGVIVRGAGLAELWPHCAVLVAMALALWWLASRRVQSFMWR